MTTTPTLWSGSRQVNSTDSSDFGNTQSGATVIGLSNGGYVVAWEDDTNRTQLGARDIIGQRYDVLGRRVEGEVILSFIYNDDDQKSVDLAALADGFLVAYQTTDAAGFGDGENVTVERYDGDGDYASFVDVRGPANDEDPKVAAFADGRSAIVYRDDSSGTSVLTLVACDAAGTPASPVALAGALTSAPPAVAALPGGTLAVAYESGGDIAFRTVTLTGQTVASGAVASGAAEGAPQLAALADGFAVVWQAADADGAGDPGIRFAVYSETGGLRVPPAPANLESVAGRQETPAVVALDDGGFFVAWRDAGLAEIQGQRFSAAGEAVGDQVVLFGGKADYADPELALLADGRFVASATRTDTTGDADVVSTIWDPRDALIVGTEAGEAITGRVEGAELRGLGGVDTLYGLSGNDTLDGGTGADILIGSGGNDTYFVDNGGDRVVEAANGGIDQVVTRVSYTLARSQSVEELRTVSKTATTAIDLAGNEVANKLVGNAGDNALDGGGGADALYGLSGNDTYSVDNGGDQVFEAAGGGSDVVLASLSFALGAGQEIEELRARSKTGTAALELSGNELTNRIVANAGNNVLNGKGGADLLYGLSGQDTFVFDTALGSGNVDRIADFSVTDDTIALSRSIFGALAAGPLSEAAFKDVSKGGPVDADDRILYSSKLGTLSYDADGSGAKAAVQFAVIDTKVVLTNADFFVV